jgi:hypothetical protein
MSSTRVRQFHAEAPSMRMLRWIILPLLAVHLVLVTFSGYRAIWQIHRLDLRASNAVLQPGETVGFDFASWGRVEAYAQLELIQGAVAETLAVKALPRNVNASYDPRPQRAAASIVLTPSMLARFTSGSATLRATGFGSMQWLRTPPPTIREQRVRLALQ